MNNKLIQTALISVAVVLSVLIYRSVMRPEKCRIVFERRKNAVITQMKDIRAAQIAFKSAKGIYANNFGELVLFLTVGKMPIVVKTGTAPEGMTEQQALDKGIITRDTLYVDAFEEIFKGRPEVDVKNLPYIPFSGGQVFRMETNTVEKGLLKVPVFKLVAPKSAYLMGIDAEMRAENKGLSGLVNLILYSNIESQVENNPKYVDLIMGSLDDPTTEGNWE